jgi:Fe2+ or Zn2+ uptake regulation protein
MACATSAYLSRVDAHVHRKLTEVQARIMRYVRRHARAAETAEGVNGVWLQRIPTTPNVVQVRHALEYLTALGLLERHHLPGRVTVFRRARARAEGHRPAAGAAPRPTANRSSPVRRPKSAARALSR